MNTGERAAALVLAWAGTYTRRLPGGLAQERRDEIASDLWEQRADAADVSSTHVALAILRRMLAGMPADLVWRHRQLRTVARQPHRQRLDGRTITVSNRTLLTRARLRLSTRRCRACGERYRRRYPYCPVCKTDKRDSGVPKGEGTFSAGMF